MQEEIARRSSLRKTSSKAKTELGKYCGKYVLSELLIQMQLLETLEHIQMSECGLREEDFLQLVLDICRVLVHCQEEGIIHSDIRLANISRHPGEWGHYMLGGFDISCIVDNNGENASTRLGTVAYAAPEQVKLDRYDRQVDIYSLDLTLYESSNKNRLPFANSTYSMGEVISRRLEIVEDVDKYLAQLRENPTAQLDVNTIIAKV